MNKIKAARLAKGLKAKELANKVELSPAMISKLESGLVGVGRDSARRIADALGVPIEDVLFPEIEKAA